MNISIFSARLHSIKVVLFERNTLTHEFPTDRKFFLCLSGSQTLYFLFRDCRAREWNKTKGIYWPLAGVVVDSRRKQRLCTGYPGLGERNHRN